MPDQTYYAVWLTHPNEPGKGRVWCRADNDMPMLHHDPEDADGLLVYARRVGYTAEVRRVRLEVVDE